YIFPFKKSPLDYINFDVSSFKIVLFKNTPKTSTAITNTIPATKYTSGAPRNTVLYTAAPSAPPESGPKIGTGAYFQFESPLHGIGIKKCASLGPKSRAGLMAYPVVPPSDRPIAVIKKPTINGFRPSVNSLAPINKRPITRMKVPIISLVKFAT